jgi:hypothetical protein
LMAACSIFTLLKDPEKFRAWHEFYTLLCRYTASPKNINLSLMAL